MKLYASLALAALASTVSSAAVSTTSNLFNLVIDSSNSKIDGRKLSACHEGAAIESLCIGDFKVNKASDEFRIQRSSSSAKYGHLTWLEDKQTNDVQSLGFYNNTQNNVLLPMFGLGKVQTFNFNSADNLIVHPDTVVNFGGQRWYMCHQTFAAYNYNVLSFVGGSDKPDISSCQKVNIKRVYVS